MTQGHEPAGYQSSRRARERARLARARGSHDCPVAGEVKRPSAGEVVQDPRPPGVELGRREHGILGAHGTLIGIEARVVGGQDGQIGITDHGGIGDNGRAARWRVSRIKAGKAGRAGRAGRCPWPIPRSAAHNRLASVPRRRRGARGPARQRPGRAPGGAADRSSRAPRRDGRAYDSAGQARSTVARAQ